MDPQTRQYPSDPVELFTHIAGALDPPMYVVTTGDGTEYAGCLVGFATQVSITPARFLVCLSDKNHTFRVARRSGHLAVHLLRSGDLSLARLFGAVTGDEVDKFARCTWTEKDHGLPVLDDAPAWFSGPILGTTVFGDHTGFLIAPDAAGRRGTLDGLVSMHDVLELRPGHPA